MNKERVDLRRIARRAMIERGFWPEFDPQALSEIAAAAPPEGPPADGARDLRDLLWCSIDNDDTRDMVQLAVGAGLPGGASRLQVAIADVDAFVRDDSAVDVHARHNTTSVYTAGGTFHMLPERLSTDLTSLVEGEDR